MSAARAVPARGRRLAAVDPAAVLCVLVRCDRLVVAIPARLVTRLVLDDEVRTTRTPSGAARVRSGDTELPAWHLGEILGVRSPVAAWLFLAADDGPRPVALALATGPCLAVRPLSAPEPLPHGLFQKHSDAIAGAFRVDSALRGRGAGIVGLWIDPVRLIGASTLAGAAAGVPR